MEVKGRREEGRTKQKIRSRKAKGKIRKITC